MRWSIVGIIHEVANFINSYDYFNYFSYTPYFYIKREPAYKSDLNAFAYVGYVAFFLYFVTVQTKDYIKGIDEVISTKDILTQSRYRNITNNDVIFGIGIVDTNEMNMKFTDFPGLELLFQSKWISYEGVIKKTDFGYTFCNATDFYSTRDWGEKSYYFQKETTVFLKEYYLCPEANFRSLMTPRDWNADLGFMQITVKIKNSSVINSTIEQLKKIRPKFELIFSSYALKIDNKEEPFETIIDSTRGSFLTQFIQTTEITLSPAIVFDDQGKLGNDYVPFKAEFNQAQEDGVVFLKGEGRKSMRIFSIDMHN